MANKTQPKKSERNRSQYFGLATSLGTKAGVIIGVVLGVLTDKWWLMGISVAGGMTVGLVIASALSSY